MLKIALGDLRHKVGGRHSVFMPIGIGYIAAYTLSRLGKDKVKIKLYDDPEKIVKDIGNCKLDIIGLSNYSWNSELSRLIFEYAKGKLLAPKTTTGPKGIIIFRISGLAKGARSGCAVSI